MRKYSLVVVALALAITDTKSTLASGYVAPIRSTHQVAYAIGATRPRMEPAKRETLAKLLIEVARRHNFDPLTGWAIIAHESAWREDAVGPDGQDIGLAQVRYTSRAACREDRHSDACQALRTQLLDPAANIRAMGDAITAWRKHCTRTIGMAPNMSDWLAGYGGYTRPSQRVHCGHRRVGTPTKWRWEPLEVPRPIRAIVDARRMMIHRLARERIH
jgi:hypothetical protein